MSSPATLSICLVTIAVSCWAFKDRTIRDRLLFRPEAILRYKEWYRLFSSALIHADGQHLAGNLISFYLFGTAIEAAFGPLILAAVYVASVLGGSLLSLYLHRHHDYAALGASGGVCGVIFASIFLMPGTDVRFLLIPLGIPGPVYAICYLVWTFFALRKGLGNIGHDAHFGGALVGLILAALIAPRNCMESPALFAGSFAFAAFCLYVLSRDPQGFTGNVFSFGKSKQHGTSRSQEYDEAIERAKERAEVDRILDKIAAKGIDSITRKERLKLNEMSAKARK